MKFRITGFTDEICADMDGQVAAVKKLGLDGLDLRSIDGINVLDLTSETVDELKQKVEDNGFVVQAIGSPVNKVKLGPTTLADEQQKLQKAIDVAQRLGVQRIRIFSPETTPADTAEQWPQVRDVLSAQINLAAQNDILLLHENDGHFFGAYPANARHIFDELACPYFKAIFDFANTVLIGFKPTPDWFPWLLPHLDTIHVKDAIVSERRVVAAGEGDAQIRETLQWLSDQGWHGTLTLEPHLQQSGALGGFSGEESFTHATTALRNVVASLEVTE